MNVLLDPNPKGDKFLKLSSRRAQFILKRPLFWEGSIVAIFHSFCFFFLGCYRFGGSIRWLVYRKLLLHILTFLLSTNNKSLPFSKKKERSELTWAWTGPKSSTATRSGVALNRESQLWIKIFNKKKINGSNNRSRDHNDWYRNYLSCQRLIPNVQMEVSHPKSNKH